MEKITLGRTGLKVTVAALGCGGHSRLGMFSKGLDNAVEIIRYAYNSGVNFFDTAYAYGTQPAVGKALEGLPRDSYIISTKFPYMDDDKIKRANEFEKNVDECLKELKTDYIDIYHIHGVNPEDYNEVRDRFYTELDRMKSKGKIRFTGITERFAEDTTHKTLKLALKDDIWDVMMVGYNILNPSAVKTILPLTLEKNIGTLCMFAVRTSLSDPERLKLDIKRMIEARQADSELVKLDKTIDFLVESGYAESIMEAAYRFCRHTEGIDMTLTGTSSVSHLADNLSSILKPELPQDVLNILENMFGRVDCVSGE